MFCALYNIYSKSYIIRVNRPKNNFFFVSTHFSYGFERLKNLLGGIPEHRDILKEPTGHQKSGDMWSLPLPENFFHL